MGVSLVLEILPQKINKGDWEKVYLETLKLVRAYPFSVLKEADVHGEKIFVISPVEGKYEAKYWRISGDFESMKTGESFLMSRNLDNHRYSSEGSLDDILKYHLENRRVPKLFYSETQGYPYHRYILAICCLIECRLSGSTMLYGSFDYAQAQKAVDWANSILNTPIDLPITVNYRKLYDRLKEIKNGEVSLKDFYPLAQDKKMTHKFIKENFEKQEIFNLFKGKMKKYDFATNIENVGTMIDFLNMGYPIEDLCNLSCFHSDGPKFQKEDFVKALCSTWIFIPEENRKAMDIFIIPKGKSDTVYSLLGKEFLAINGFMGMNIEKYVPKDEFSLILKDKFKCLDNIDSIIEEKNEIILNTLEEMMKHRNKLKEKFEDYEESNIISDLEYCIHWKGGMGLSEDIVLLLKSAKNLIDDMNSGFERLGYFENLGMPFSHTKYLQTIAKIADSVGIVLSTKAWGWIENIHDSNIFNSVLFILLNLYKKEKKEECNLAIALLENKELFFEYMVD